MLLRSVSSVAKMALSPESLYYQPPDLSSEVGFYGEYTAFERNVGWVAVVRNGYQIITSIPRNGKLFKAAMPTVDDSAVQFPETLLTMYKESAGSLDKRAELS